MSNRQKNVVGADDFPDRRPPRTAWIQPRVPATVAQPEGHIVRSYTLFVCCALLLLGLPGSVSADPQQDSDSCGAALNRKEWTLALDDCNRAIQSGQLRGQGLTEALVMRCWAQIELKKPDDAIADCTEA